MGTRTHLLVGRLLPHAGKPEAMKRFLALQKQLRESHGWAVLRVASQRVTIIFFVSTPELVVSL